MIYFNQNTIQPPSDHNIVAYDREQIVTLLWALGAQAVKSGYDNDKMYVFFDHDQPIVKLDDAIDHTKFLDFASLPEQLLVIGSTPVKYKYTSVPQIVSAYLSNVEIYVEYHAIVAAAELWASNLAAMKVAKRSAPKRF